jgi:hypothetical protein
MTLLGTYHGNTKPRTLPFIVVVYFCNGHIKGILHPRDNTFQYLPFAFE